MFNLDIIKSDSIAEIKKSIPTLLERYGRLFPVSKEAKILLKPNLNATMNALTGNTTDLRLLASVIEYLKAKGYKHIAIGEGTNSGYYRNHINVISRLKVDRLAKYFGVQVIDLNYSEPVYIDFENKVKAGIAKDVMEADFFINMPKLKTHFEAGMSVCLKNLMGCLVGQENKKKTHKSLAKNIIHLNRSIKPQLHIVDGMIAMEGLGPTTGIPIHTGLIIVGEDPILVDLVCAKIAFFDYKKVITLRTAEAFGLLNKTHLDFVDSLDLGQFQKRFLPPKPGFLAQLIHSPKRQKYFLAIRNTRMLNYLCSTELIGKVLFLAGLRQDHIVKEEMIFEGLYFNKTLCQEGCKKCEAYCPLGLKLPDQIGEKNNSCIGCLYCYLTCPTKAIDVGGELGFMKEQMKQYDGITRRIA